MHEKQLTQMAGEFLTAGKLFKRGYQTRVTLGNAKAIDLIAHNPKTGKVFVIQVKTLRRKNCFDLRKEEVNREYVFVFVFLNDFPESEEFFILRGQTLLSEVNRFWGTSYTGAEPCSRPGVNYGPLKQYKDNWVLFDQSWSIQGQREVSSTRGRICHACRILGQADAHDDALCGAVRMWRRSGTGAAGAEGGAAVAGGAAAVWAGGV
jgi:hypothetical protein